MNINYCKFELFLFNNYSNLYLLNQHYPDIKKKLRECGLKLTPQRIAVLEAVMTLSGHPTAENIMETIRIKHPEIATGTVYHILETFTEKGLISKVKTIKDVMRYDAIQKSHHHLYSCDTEKIEDYFDEDINEILNEYFQKKQIKDFEIKDIKLQLIGKFR